jgi:methionyl-tRNA formyltransferase
VKVLVLCGPRLDDFQRSVLRHVIHGSHVICGCLVDCQDDPSLTARLLENLRRGRGGYVLVMAVKLAVRRRSPTKDAVETFRHLGVSTIVASDPYEDTVVREARTLEADVAILLGGFGILREPLLSLPRDGVLSYHHGDMRQYRGQPPAFWELYNGANELLVTVQRLTADLDRGEAIVERRFGILPSDTLRAVSKAIFDGSADMMAEALDLVASPGFVPDPIQDYGPVYTLPNLRQWLIYNARISWRVVRSRLHDVRTRAI